VVVPVPVPVVPVPVVPVPVVPVPVAGAVVVLSVPVAGAVVVSVPVAGAVVVPVAGAVVVVSVPVAGAVVVVVVSVPVAGAVVVVSVPVAGAVVVVSVLLTFVVVVDWVLKYQIAAMTRIAMIAAATHPIGELSPRGGRGLMLLFTEFAIVSVSGSGVRVRSGIKVQGAGPCVKRRLLHEVPIQSDCLTGISTFNPSGSMLMVIGRSVRTISPSVVIVMCRGGLR
jgi:hypothetical protein